MGPSRTTLIIALGLSLASASADGTTRVVTDSPVEIGPPIAAPATPDASDAADQTTDQTNGQPAETSTTRTQPSEGAPATSPSDIERLPLGLPSSSVGLPSADPETERETRRSLMGSAMRTIGALGLVIGLIVGLRMFVTRAARSVPGGPSLRSQLGAAGRAPSGLLFVLGRYPIAKGQTLVLLQLDTRVLLLAQSQAGFQTLCEVTDAGEVASILSKARDEEGESLSARFNTLLSELSTDPRTADPRDIRGPEPVAAAPAASLAAGDEVQERLAGLRSRLAGLGAERIEAERAEGARS